MHLFADVSEHVTDPWLRRAFLLAERGRGSTSPNPIVGCVIVRDGEVVGEGYHARAGLPHAEIEALQAAGERARGATVYVTLEPCTHHGRTPPCTDALISAGVGRVVVGMPDPNDAVSGGGAHVLRAAGTEVIVAADPAPFVEQNEAWLASLGRGRPFVRAKLAVSLDGHSALRQGERANITGASGAEVTRALRARADAVLVGEATLAADDPSLTARESDGSALDRQPMRVVLARTHVPDPQARVFVDGIARTLVLAPGRIAKAAREVLPHAAEVAEYDDEDGIESALRTLFEMGVTDLLVEPGPRLLTALWEASAIDELVLVQAGGMAGGGAPASFLGIPNVEAAEGDSDHTLSHVLEAAEAGVVGDVAVSVWRPGVAAASQRHASTHASEAEAQEWSTVGSEG